MESEIRALLSPLVIPDATEVRRARKLIDASLRDGQPHGTFELLELFSGAEHVGRPSSGMSGAIPLDLPVDRASWRAVITRDHPVTRWLRLDRASIEALSDLVTMGLAMGMGADLQAGDVHDIHWQFSVTSSSLILPRGLQQLRSVTYRRPYRLLAQPALPVEPDVFLDDLAALGLDRRTERTLREAVESFRRGLYLACASLLGATSEGAWFAFGERFRASVPGLARALDDGKAEQVQAKLVQALRDAGSRLKRTADDLATSAATFRALRNYGVHPRGEVQPDLEPVFDEEACGMLLLNSHRYLTRMGRAADELAAAKGAEEPEPEDEAQTAGAARRPIDRSQVLRSGEGGPT